MNAAMTDNCVEPAISASVNATMISAGSASDAIITSRLEPMPPKLVPMSSPTSARKNRALPSSATMAMQVGRDAETSVRSRMSARATRRSTSPRRSDTATTRNNHEALSASTDFLAQQLPEIAIRLQQRRSPTLLQARFRPCGRNRSIAARARARAASDRTCSARSRIIAQNASSDSRPTSVMNTRPRYWRIVSSCSAFARSLTKPMYRRDRQIKRLPDQIAYHDVKTRGGDITRLGHETVSRAWNSSVPNTRRIGCAKLLAEYCNAGLASG